jgi:hypothetical protein
MNTTSSVREILRLGVLCAFVIAALPPSALAKPKQGGGSAKCGCDCIADSGVNGGILIVHNTYNSMGYSCSAFEGATCNVNNPYTGGVSTGTLSLCADQKSGSKTMLSISPFGGVTVLRR